MTHRAFYIGHRCVLVVVTILFIGQMLFPLFLIDNDVAAAPIAKVTKFQGGASYKDVTFNDRYTDTTTAKLEFQKGINVSDTSFLVDGQKYLDSYPSNITIDVGGNGLPDWQWTGIGYGALGKQEHFLVKSGTEQNKTANLTIPGGGGDNKTASIRLPTGAIVTNATVELEVKGVAIAIECKTGSRSCDQLNNDPVYSLRDAFNEMGWTATIVTGTDIDSVDELGKYTVVVLGDAGYNDDDHSVFQSALRTWVTTNGGGMIGIGWILYSTPAGSDMDFLLPVSGGYNYQMSGQVTITNPNHPVTQGVNNFNVPVSTHCEYPSSNTVDAGAQTLGTCSGPTIVVSDKGAGRTMYIGPNAFGDFQGYQSKSWYNDLNFKKLIQQSALWASGGGSLSGYIDIGDDGTKEWDKQNFNGSEFLPDMSATLNAYMGTAAPTYTDGYGNRFVDIPITVHSTSAGLISLKNLTISYTYSAKVEANPHNGSLANEINGIIPDVLGATNVTIPVHISSDTPGLVKLHSLSANLQDPVHAPLITSFEPAVDKVELDENTTVAFKVSAIDWYRYPITYAWFLDDKQNTTGDSYEYRPDFDSMGTHNVTVKVSNGLQDSFHWWVVVVKNVNRPPRIINYTPDLRTSVYENTTTTFKVTAADPDKGNPVGFVWALDGISGGSGTNTYDYKTGYKDAGTHTLDLTAKDPSNAKATLRWTIEVLDVNAAPEITAWGPKTDPTMSENSSLNFMIKARSPDDDPIYYSWYIDEKAVPLADDPLFDYKTSFNDAGTHKVRAQVSDGRLSANRTWSVEVTDVNRPPVAKIQAPKDDQEFLTSQNISFSAKGSTDPDGDELTYDWYKGMTKLGSGEENQFKLPKGLQTIDLRVDDGRDGVTVSQVTIIVRELKFQITIETDNTAPRDGDTVKFKVTIKSVGDADGTDLPVTLFVDGVSKENRSIDAISPDETQIIEFDWVAREGVHTIRVGVAQDKAERPITVQKALLPIGGGTNTALLLILILIIAIVCSVIVAAVVVSKRKKKARALQEAPVATPVQPAVAAPYVAQPVAPQAYEAYQQPVPPPPPPPPPPQPLVYAEPARQAYPLPPPPPQNYYQTTQPEVQPIAEARAYAVAPVISSAGTDVETELASTEAIVDAAAARGVDVLRARNHLRLAKFFQNKGDRTKALDYCRKAKEASGG